MPATAAVTWHRAHGSQLDTRTAPVRSRVPRSRHALRMASTSACAVGSCSCSSRLTPVPRISPPRTTSAPNGSWPASAFCTASSIAWWTNAVSSGSWFIVGLNNRRNRSACVNLHDPVRRVEGVKAVGGASAQPPVGAAASGVSFEGFARRERRPLVELAWSLTGDLGVAEDLAQEALEAAWQAWDRVGGYDRPGAWARRVVANRAAGHTRRASRERRALGRLAGRRAARVELEPADGDVWAAIRTLPARQAQVVALHYLEDLSVAEIAGVLACAAGTVKVHLHRGRLALAQQLGILTQEDER